MVVMTTLTPHPPPLPPSRPVAIYSQLSIIEMTTPLAPHPLLLTPTPVLDLRMFPVATFIEANRK